MFASLSDTLSVAIGVVFIFLLLSILTSYVMELIARIFDLRAKNLANALQILLDPSTHKFDGATQLKKAWADSREIWDKGVAGAAEELYHKNVAAKLDENLLKAVYSHPIIKTITEPQKLPSNIPAREFSSALFDLLMTAGTETPTKPEEFLAAVKKGVNGLSNNSLKMVLLPLIENAEATDAKLETQVLTARKNVETWFNTVMTQSSSWYKRKAQTICLVCSLVIAILLNADTVGISQSLWRDASLRQSLSTAAEVYIQNNNQTQADQALAELKSLNLPLGWNGKLADSDPLTPVNPQEFPTTAGDIFLKIIGLSITGLAISQGSALWFDALKNLLNLRTTGSVTPPAEESKKSG